MTERLLGYSNEPGICQSALNQNYSVSHAIHGIDANCIRFYLFCQSGIFCFEDNGILYDIL